MNSVLFSILHRRTRALALSAFVTLTAVDAERAVAQPTDLSGSIDVTAGAVFSVREETYTLPDVQLNFPDEPDTSMGIPVEMLGVVVTPENAPGPHPVAVFIHGQNYSCYDPNSSEAKSEWPCREGFQPVPSYRGFLDYQRALAARGWATVSISGNGISGNIIAFGETSDTLIRAQLVEAHLRQWAAWSRGESPGNAPRFIADGVLPDLQQVLLVGHSRGGSTANQVALRSATDATLPWRVRAQVLISPVAAHMNPAPTVPVVVLLPACDGDVTDLRGQIYIDRANGMALRSSVSIHGANHAFFNREWDPATAVARGAAKDDAEVLFADGMSHGACRPGAPERLGGEQQRELGSFYIAAAAKGLVSGDLTVLPLLDGSPVCAGSSCRARVSTHALGGRRQPLLTPTADSVVSAGSELTIAPCLTNRNVGVEGACITADMPEFKERPRTPHFGSAIEGVAEKEPTRTALRMEWSAPAGSARVRLSHGELDTDVSSVALRVIVDPDTTGTQLALALVDGAGRALPLGAATLDGVPSNAGPGTGVYWAQEAHFAIDRAAAAASGFDFGALAELEIVTQSASGRVWVLDAWGYRPGLSDSVGSAARFELSVKEAVLEAGKVRVPGTVIGELREAAEIYYYIPDGERALEDTFSVNAGEKNFEVVLPVPQDASAGVPVQFLGIRGMVPTQRDELVPLPMSEAQ